MTEEADIVARPVLPEERDFLSDEELAGRLADVLRGAHERIHAQYDGSLQQDGCAAKRLYPWAVAANEIGGRRSMLAISATAPIEGASWNEPVLAGECILVLADPVVIPVDGSNGDATVLRVDDTVTRVITTRNATLLGTVVRGALAAQRVELRLSGDLASATYLAWRRLVGEGVADEGLRGKPPRDQAQDVFDQWHAAFSVPEGHVSLREVVAEFQSAGHAGSLEQAIRKGATAVFVHHMHLRVQAVHPNYFFDKFTYYDKLNIAFPNETRDARHGFQVTLLQEQAEDALADSLGLGEPVIGSGPDFELSVGPVEIGWSSAERLVLFRLWRRRLTSPVLELGLGHKEAGLSVRLLGREIEVLVGEGSFSGGDSLLGKQVFRIVVRRNGRLRQDLALRSDAHAVSLVSRGTTVLTWRTDGTNSVSQAETQQEE